MNSVDLIIPREKHVNTGRLDNLAYRFIFFFAFVKTACGWSYMRPRVFEIKDSQFNYVYLLTPSFLGYGVNKQDMMGYGKSEREGIGVTE